MNLCDSTNSNTIIDMLQTVWNELDYCVDVCRITECIYRAPVRNVKKLGVLLY